MSLRMRRPVTPVISLTTRGELEIHLDQRFLHTLNETARALNECRAVPEIPAQGNDAVGGAETPAQEAEDVEVAEPFAVRDITLAAREVLHVTRVDEDHLETAGIEDLEDGIQ